MKEKAIELKCEELESVINATDWTNGAATGFGVGAAIVVSAAAAVTWFAFT